MIIFDVQFYCYMSWGEVPVGCMQVGKMSLKGTQLFPNMLPYKLPLFRNPLNYTICRIYTAGIFAIYTYSLFFVGFPNVFQALSRAGWLGTISRNRCEDVTGILPNKGGSVGRRDHDLPYVKWNIYNIFIYLYRDMCTWCWLSKYSPR